MRRLLYSSAAAIIWALFFASSPSQGSELVTISGNTMGTSYSIKFFAGKSAAGKSSEEKSSAADEPTEVSQLRSQIELRLKEIDERMSTYRVDSEVSRFNRAAGGAWFPVSEDTASVVALAQSISRNTGGAFDITVGPLVSLWNFGASSDPSQGFVPPSAEQIRSAQARVGFDKLEVRREPPALRKTLDRLEIDLSGIAKGFAVDQLCDILKACGVHNYLVEIGGEMRVAGTRPDGQRWTVGIESPDRNARRLTGTISPLDSAIASSGDYRSYHEYEGVLYSHTLDPRTGYPIDHALAAVTILANNCATADAQATALLVLGPHEGHEWAENNGVAALMFSRSGRRTATTRTSHFDIPFVHNERGEAPARFGYVFVLSFLVFAIALVAMAIGVIVSNRRLKGSCGGLAGLKDEHGNTLCDGCSNPAPDCAGTDDKQETIQHAP